MSELHAEKLMRLYKWSRGVPSPPWKIDLEPTHACNLACVFCWTRDEKRLGYAAYRTPLDEKRLLEIVDEAAELGVREWQIAGGWEPMIKPKMTMKLMRRIKELGMYGCLTTNGTLFQPEMIEELVRIGWDQILISLEGPTADIHDHLVGKSGAFAAATGAMRAFKEWMKKLDSDVPRYSFHTVINTLNYDRMDDMVRLAHDLGCFALDAEPITVWSDEFQHLRMSTEHIGRFQSLLPAVLELAAGLGLHTNLRKMVGSKLVDKSDIADQMSHDVEADYANRFLNTPCFEPWLNMEIRASGHVVPCRLNDDDDYISVHDSSLKDIWYGRYFQEIREQLMDKRLPGYCATCAAGMVRHNRLIRDRLLEMGADLPRGETLPPAPAEDIIELPDVRAVPSDVKERERLQRRMINQNEQVAWLENEIMKTQSRIMALDGDHQSYERLTRSPLYAMYRRVCRVVGRRTPGLEE
ncbi:radical SAM protein [bacterium]|nr:radical SAM protein [candidate division CSSED10-310 bacterium]